ncbi:hypothetical protein [Cupriavidus basilensis]|uniref:hypothetical protein n=1 Tax=Cupriavidus basilensis TaxID=68895 RepID=UPI0039F6C03F
MILFVAPYHYPEEARGSLGAARKIELILEQLAGIDEDIVLINTNGTRNGGGLDLVEKRIGNVYIRELALPYLFNETITKIKSLFLASWLVNHILKSFGSPRFIWLYNGYAFESVFGRISKKKLGCPVILEFEDWHFARKRGFSPKPLLDWLAWRLLENHVDVSFAVNSTLARRLGARYGACHLLPGIVPRAIAFEATENIPFAGERKSINIGYFGQLNTEKGVILS